MASLAEKHDALAGLARSLAITPDEVAEFGRSMDQPLTISVDEAIERVLPTVASRSRPKYRAGLHKLSIRCGPSDLTSIDLSMLKRWREEVIDEASLDPRYKHGHGAGEGFVQASRLLFTAMVEDGVLHHNPTERLRSPPRPHSDRRALSAAEITEIFDVADFSGRDPGLDGLIFWYLLETACRREGLLGLRHAAINPNEPSIRIQEKYRRERELPISASLCDALLEHRANRNPDGPGVFHYRDGTPLTRRRFDTFFGRVQRSLGWAREIGVSAHWARHTTLTRIMEAAGPRVAQAYAGHSDGASGTIGIYTKVDFRHLKQAHAAVFQLETTP